MDIKDRTVLVWGGGGLVGSAICRKLVDEKPKRIILTSLLRSEAEEAVRELREEFPRTPSQFFVPWWGNIFVRHELKDIRRDEIISDPASREMLIDDTLAELTERTLRRSSIFKLIESFKPEIIVDCINSATAIAYQDIFQSARRVRQQIKRNKRSDNSAALRSATEQLLCTLYTPSSSVMSSSSTGRCTPSRRQFTSKSVRAEPAVWDSTSPTRTARSALRASF